MSQQSNLFNDGSPATPNPSYQQEGPITIDPDYDNRSILSKATGFISDYTFTLNPYSGCAFGCQYCYAASFVALPKNAPEDYPFTQPNWGKWVRVKKNAINLIKNEVAKGNLNQKSIYMSSVTDPYQPTERRTGQTRLVLQELAKARQLGLVIQTRGPLANNDEDIDLCRQICKRGGRVQVNMTITTNDEDIRKACEPTCPSYRQRLDAITAINKKTRNIPGYTTCITMSPLLPTEHPTKFAEDLLKSGITRFIIQPTHTGRPAGGGRFRAATRNEIVEQLATHWKCSPDEVADLYQDNYDTAVAQIVPLLEKAKCFVGFGRPGFGRPWRKEWYQDQSKRPKDLTAPSAVS